MAGAKGNADRDANSMTTRELDCALGKLLALDLTEEVRFWVDHPDLNAGLLLEGVASGVASDCTFGSKDATTLTQRPVLQVTYY